eukprot:Skav202042  [mRNA]  locus=scaffold1138:321323:326719:- [translate_table: standard]
MIAADWQELQRKELESLLESPSGEKQKEARGTCEKSDEASVGIASAKMKSLEAKIAEMQIVSAKTAPPQFGSKMTGKIGQLTLLILSTLGVVHAVTFPLDPPELSEKCLCAEQDDAGWSSQQNRCLSSSVTSCLECPTRQVCAGIKDLAGDGLQIFYGDCRSGSSCIPATESSLGFAVSIALDQQNNVFFSDQGNNRIRMLDVSLNALVTIAGTGAIGFAGDGGLAHQALLRHPEGLALKPNLASGQEVYFADFLNQRLRKLVKSGSDWYIYTVAGTGVMASDSSCDTGCVPLEASLWNPRALAFASNQEHCGTAGWQSLQSDSRNEDLYFVESGSKKILKLTTSIGDPGQNPNATLIAFAGHGLPQSTQGSSAAVWAGSSHG